MESEEKVSLSPEEKKELAEIFKKIDHFFDSTEYESVAKRSRIHVMEMSEYIRESKRVKDKVLSQPFTI